MNNKTKAHVFFYTIYLSGFGLLWWQTNWRVVIATVLIGWGILLQSRGWPDNPK